MPRLYNVIIMDYMRKYKPQEPNELYINGLQFYRTGYMCPEQWDVFEVAKGKYNTNKLVGYVRLRHGQLSADVPDVRGEEVYYTHQLRGDGCFDDNEERIFHMTNIAQVIGDWIMIKKAKGERYTSDDGPECMV